MKKTLLLLLLLLVLLNSGCVFPGQRAQIEYGYASAATEDLSLTVEAFPAEVKQEKSTSLYFTVENKQQFDIESAAVSIYDTCLFTGETTKDIGTLGYDDTETWSWRYTAGKTEFEKDCNIRFKLAYIAPLNIYQTIAVLQEAEYQQELRSGEISKIDIQQYSTSNPLKISLSFSDPQPFIDNTDLYIYIDYTNTGSGFIDKLEKGDITIKIPDNLALQQCNDYRQEGSKLILDKDLTFINNRAKQSLCKFKTKSAQPKDLKTLTITANYKYELDNSIIIKIKPR